MICYPVLSVTQPYSRILIWPLILCVLLFFALTVSSNSWADLPPKQKQDIIKSGLKAGDQDQQIKDLEKQIKKNPPNKKDLEKSRDRLKERINNKSKQARDKVIGGGEEGGKLFDKAREARNKQNELKELKAQLKNDPNNKKLKRKIKNLEFLLENDYKDLGKLPDPPKASSAGGGGTGGPPSSSTGNISQSFKARGTVKLASGQNVASTSVGLNQVSLSALGTVSLVSQGETPIHLLDPNRDTKKASGVGGRWPEGSKNSAIVGQLTGNGYEYVAGPNNFFYSHALTMFNSEPFTHTGVLSEIKTTVGVGFNTGTKSVPFGTLYGGQATKGWLNSGILNVNDWVNNLYEFDPDFNVWRQGAEFKQLNNLQFNWFPSNSPAGNFSDVQVAPAIKLKWDWFAPDAIVNVEPNHGILAAPAPGFHPESWPKTEAFPLPHLSIQGVR